MTGKHRKPECRRCNGEGQIANTEEGEPWSAWENIPPEAAIAVLIGFIKPISCPDCGGTGSQ